MPYCTFFHEISGLGGWEDVDVRFINKGPISKFNKSHNTLMNTFGYVLTQGD